MIGEYQNGGKSSERPKGPPDPRMNRSSEHYHRLSLGRPLLSSSVVTRATTGLHCLLVRLPACIGCNSCVFQGAPFLSVVETAYPTSTGSLHVVLGCSDQDRLCHNSSTASVLESSKSETPPNWPASLIPAAIRYAFPIELTSDTQVFAGTPPWGVCCCLRYDPQIPVCLLIQFS